MKALMYINLLSLVLISMVLSGCNTDGESANVAYISTLDGDQSPEYRLHSRVSSLGEYVDCIEAESNFKIIRDDSVDFSNVYNVNIYSIQGWEDVLFQLIYSIDLEVEKVGYGTYKVYSSL